MTFETLDPADWEQTRKLAHQMLDMALDHTRDVRDRPIWQDMPQDVRAGFETSAPQQGMPLKDVLDDVNARVMEYPMGNIHPRFWAWYMGAGNFTGAMADFLAAIQGSNLGGGNHAAALIDRQVVDWLREMIGLPEGSSGTLTSGGSVANMIGLTVARNVQSGIDMRQEGVAAMDRPMRYYGSEQMHSCHQKSLETIGLGNAALRRVPTLDDLTMDLDALARMVAQDREDGLNPACVIATAGTVNTGAVDDLNAIGAFCRQEGLWFHVDGCIGALIAIAPDNGWRVAGIEGADSVALDPHKWLHAPFEVGCALVRDHDAHHGTFTLTPEYLKPQTRGVAGAAFLHDYGLQTTRGFRALKVWMSLREHGVQKFGRLIDQDIEKAQYLTGLIEAQDNLTLMFPTSINIVCFRYDPGGLSAEALREINSEIMLHLQEEGTAVISDTTVRGSHCLRVAVNNHRTRTEDLDLLVAEILRLGQAMRPAA